MRHLNVNNKRKRMLPNFIVDSTVVLKSALHCYNISNTGFSILQLVLFDYFSIAHKRSCTWYVPEIG